MSHHTENNHVHTEFNPTESSSSLDNGATRATRTPHHKVQRDEANQNHTAHALPAGQWLRAVLGFDAPFGHDGLPTVWG